MHLLAPVLRRRLVLTVEWVLVVAILEGVFSQVLRGLGLRAVVGRAFTLRALEWWAAIVVALVVFLLSARARDGFRGARQRLFPADPKQRTRNSVWLSVAVLALVIVLPRLLGSLLSEVLANVGLFLLMGLGLNIVVGLAGMLDLGYVAFFAVGAYTVGVLTSPLSPRFTLEWSWWAALPVALLVSAIAGVLIGAPVIRMRGDYLAIVTLGFGEIIRILFLSDWLSPTFGGAQGVLDIPGIPLGFTRVSGISPEAILYFAAAFVLIAAWVSWSLQQSRVGRAWNALREDETVAAAMGINIVRAKLNAFVVGAILAGLAGALFAAKLGSIFPSSFELLVSIIILVVVIVGGMGNIAGVAVGAVVLIGVLGGPNVPGLLQEFSEFKLLIYGALLVFMMLRRPEGLLPSAVRYRELHAEELTQDAWFDKGETSPVGKPPNPRSGQVADVHAGDTRAPQVLRRHPGTGGGGSGGARRRDRVGDRAQRRRQDLLLQRGDRHLPARRGRHPLRRDSILGLEPSEITAAGVARTFQNVRLFPNMTVLENVMVAQHCRTRAGAFRAVFRTPFMRREEAEIRAYAEEILSFFGTRLVGYRFDQPAVSLSYANRRRLEIARAMATRPRLILLDEPVAGMNPRETAELTDLIHKLRDERDLTVVVVEHDMGVVRDVSDRVVVLDHGVKIAEGAYDEVSTDEAVIEAYLGRPADLAR